MEQIPEPEEPKQSQQRGPVHLQQLAGGSLHIACETEKYPPAAEEGQEFLKVVEDEASGVLPVAVVSQVPRPQQGDKPVEEQVGHKVQRSQFPKGQPKEGKLP